MRLFGTFWTQIVLANFSKKCHFNKKDHSSSQPLKNTIFWAFLKVSFSICSSFLLWFIQYKKDKNPKHIFFGNPFLTPWQTAPKHFCAPTHYLCFLKTPPKHYKIGEEQAKKILDRFSAQPWTDFQLKKRQILDRFSALQHIYIYIYTYTYIHYAVRPGSGPILLPFWKLGSGPIWWLGSDPRWL